MAKSYHKAKSAEYETNFW